MTELDSIRKERKKFICLNDNINHDKDGADLVREKGGRERWMRTGRESYKGWREKEREERERESLR